MQSIFATLLDDYSLFVCWSHYDPYHLLYGCVELPEGRSVVRIICPAEVHQPEEGGGTLGREGQTFPVLDPVDDLIVLDADKGFYPSH